MNLDQQSTAGRNIAPYGSCQSLQTVLELDEETFHYAQSFQEDIDKLLDE